MSQHYARRPHFGGLKVRLREWPRRRFNEAMASRPDGQYINDSLVKKGVTDGTRKVATAAIRKFYETNDSPL